MSIVLVYARSQVTGRLFVRPGEMPVGPVPVSSVSTAVLEPKPEQFANPGLVPAGVEASVHGPPPLSCASTGAGALALASDHATSAATAAAIIRRAVNRSAYGMRPPLPAKVLSASVDGRAA